MTGQAEKQQEGGRGAAIGLAIFALYVVVLALAAISEIFNFGWFDFPVFK
ncbi:hypothetical protein ACFL4X_00700 [Gemmatimonadota bacterium]